ncbi:MAG: PD-(D/E)XK nuclease family transposase [Selenomonadaceae bacterium]|nr:PD-(D/E)XK nuclease family transposase [Selenomonadaceae bacterium]
MKIDFFAEVQRLTLMDDVFMSAVFENDTELTAFVLKIILNLDLKVTSVRVQEPLTNLKGRGVRLDIHAISEDGKHFNIEIQRQDKGATAKRARYNISLLDANNLSAGEDFDALPETYVIFITERDVLKLGEPIYFIERTITGTGKLFNDGAHIVYVNNSIQDDTPLGKLMHDFACANPDEMFYKIFADKTGVYKNENEETTKMAGVIEEIRERAILENTINMAKKLISIGKMTLEEIAAICELPLEKVQELASKKTVDDLN